MRKKRHIFLKINPKDILKNHFSTLVNDNSKKPDFDDYLTFAIVPLIVAAVLTYFNLTLNDSSIGIIIATLSIIVGLLFNVIVIIFDIIKRDSSKKLKNEVLKQLLSNISYTILISIVAIIFTLVTYVEQYTVKKIANFIVIFILSHYLITVLMILKRMYLLFMNELKEIEKNQNNKPVTDK